MSNVTSSRIDQFLAFYNGLSSSNIDNVAGLYHPDIVFIDPVQQISGRQNLIAYFQHAYARLNYCQFVATGVVQQAEQDCLSWQMTLSHPAIAGGKQIIVDGCSVLQWQQRQIIAHRDYYDLHQMVFQHIPVLGWATQKITRRMADSST